MVAPSNGVNGNAVAESNGDSSKKVCTESVKSKLSSPTSSSSAAQALEPEASQPPITTTNGTSKAVDSDQAEALPMEASSTSATA